MTVELPDSPANREEAYLATIAGETGVELPAAPKSRKEQYLAYIAENGGGGGGGTTNYNNLTNKPTINSVTLQGNKTTDDLGLVAKDDGVLTGTTTAENITISGDLTVDSVDVETSITVPTPSDNTDAANKQFVVSYAAINGAGAPTTATVAKYVGQLYYDTTNSAMYYCSAIDSVTPSYTWTSFGGGVQYSSQAGAPSSSTGNTGDLNESTSDYRNAVYIKNSQGWRQVVTNDNADLNQGLSIIDKASGNAMFTVYGNSNVYQGGVAIGQGSLVTAKGQMDIGTQSTTFGYNSSNYRLLTGLYDGQSAHDAATVAQALGETETYTIATSDWTALASSSPYTYSATVTATHTIGSNTVIELLNDQPVLFATNGFAVGSVSSQSVTIYSIGQPSASATLKINYKG